MIGPWKPASFITQVRVTVLCMLIFSTRAVCPGLRSIHLPSEECVRRVFLHLRFLNEPVGGSLIPRA